MKGKIYIVIMIIFNSVDVFSQTPDWQWAKGMKGRFSTSDYNHITRDSLGNIYVMGSFWGATTSFDSISLSNSDTSANPTPDIFVAKYDSTGNVLWAKKAIGIYTDRGVDIAADANGNCFVIGNFGSPTISFDSITLGHDTIANYFIVKYDNAGNVMWAKEIDGTASGISADGNGNAYLTGYYSTSTIIFDNDTLINNGNTSLFLTKYDANGNIVWAENAWGGNASVVKGISICVDKNGNSYLTGNYDNLVLNVFYHIYFGNDSITTIAGYGMFIAKYNSLGDMVWATGTVGTTSNNYRANTIAVDEYGNTYVTANDLTNGLSRTLLKKYDVLGNMVWVKNIDAPIALLYSETSGLAVDKQGNVYMTGYFEGQTIGFDNVVLTNAKPNIGWGPGSSDIYIAKYNNAGNVLWAKSLGGISHDEGSDITIGADNNIYLTGIYVSPILPFNDDTLTVNDNNFDAFVAKLNNTVATNASIENPFVTMNEICVFPNPSNGVFVIQSEEKISGVEITNIVGKRIYSEKANSPRLSIDLSKVNPGVYFITLYSEKQIVTKRMIVNN